MLRIRIRTASKNCTVPLMHKFYSCILHANGRAVPSKLLSYFGCSVVGKF